MVSMPIKNVKNAYRVRPVVPHAVVMVFVLRAKRIGHATKKENVLSPAVKIVMNLNTMTTVIVIPVIVLVKLVMGPPNQIV